VTGEKREKKKREVEIKKATWKREQRWLPKPELREREILGGGAGGGKKVRHSGCGRRKMRREESRGHEKRNQNGQTAMG